MVEITKKLIIAKEKLRLWASKNTTNFGLKLVTVNKQVKNTKEILDVSYGSNKLQRFDILVPTNVSKSSLVFYVHGGSWCGGDKFGYSLFCKKIAQMGYTVCNINYRLMPKVNIKTCLEDCISAIRYFTNNYSQIFKDLNLNLKINLDKTFLIGDSAGAHIVSFIAGKLSTKKIRLKIKVKGLGLYYGVYDFNSMNLDASPILNNLYKYFISTEKNPKKLFNYISTTTYITPNYPPCFITSGKIDKLNLQTLLMMNYLKENNVEMYPLIFDVNRLDAMHAFLNMPLLKSSKEAFKMLTKFLKDKTKD